MSRSKVTLFESLSSRCMQTNDQLLYLDYKQMAKVAERIQIHMEYACNYLKCSASDGFVIKTTERLKERTI